MGAEAPHKPKGKCMTLKRFIHWIEKRHPAPVVHAHCDGPCGVYDPAQARVSAEAVVAMTKKILALKPEGSGPSAELAYRNTLVRYIQIKEQQAHETKTHLLVLWTDYFKPNHLEKNPKLHEVFWKAAKLCSACKVEVSPEKAEALLKAVQEIHGIFWASKDRKVEWVTAA